MSAFQLLQQFEASKEARSCRSNFTASHSSSAKSTPKVCRPPGAREPLPWEWMKKVDDPLNCASRAATQLNGQSKLCHSSPEKVDSLPPLSPAALPSSQKKSHHSWMLSKLDEDEETIIQRVDATLIRHLQEVFPSLSAVLLASLLLELDCKTHAVIQYLHVRGWKSTLLPDVNQRCSKEKPPSAWKAIRFSQLGQKKKKKKTLFNL